MAADWSVKGGQATVEGLCPSNGWEVLLNASQVFGLVNIEKWTVQFAVGDPGKLLIYSFDLQEEKGYVQYSNFNKDRSSSRAV